ncbi:MAG TPA: choice-of-anchor Q domain-containing protein [Gallionellaceae bacterium]|nr:choice-of-anchor Q domain-containing protein [Gallionellaceae bacterium]
MRANTIKMNLIKAGLTASILLLASGVSLADSAVTLTAAPTTTTLPDGQTVPMWGYSCGAVSAGVSCTAANGVAQAGGVWQPPLITVPSGEALTITLNNNLSFTAGTGTNSVPTSLVIVGQLGGGLGAAPARMPSPAHVPQGTTWPGTLGTTNPGDPVFTPPTQADRVRSFATEVAAGSSANLTWTAVNLRPGTYLIQSGTQPSIQGPMGLYGVLVVTDANYPGQTFDKDAALLLSEIDPLQNTAVDTAVRTAGFSDALVWNGQTGQCGNPAVHTCYPPAVNYTPRYFLINGVSFDRSNPANSSLSVLSPAIAGDPVPATTGRVLLRFVNAGLRMHIPSVVGANMTLLAEDGNKLPGVPKVQSSLFLAAGKTYDVTIQPKQTTAGTYDAATYAVFDRQLSLSTANQRDGGMQTYVNVAGGAAPAPAAAVARADSYSLVAGNALAVAEAAKGLIANDTGVYGVQLLTAPTGVGSTVSLNADGTFTYTPGAGVTSDSFSYCANGTVSGTTCSSGLTATVNLAQCTGSCMGGAPVASADSYTSNIASRLQISPPGVLGNDTDPSGFPLKAVLSSAGTCSSVILNPDGSFTVTASGASCAFTYTAANSQNTVSGAATATVNFGAASNLAVTLRDGKTGEALPADYRWIIQEDRSVLIDPKIETTSSTAAVRNLAVNFHTSTMPVVAQGCVGTVSCESGQTLLGVPAVCDIGNGACRTGVSQQAEVNPSQVHLDPLKRYYISILPGDAANPVVDGSNGHTMSGAQIAAGQTAVDVNVQKTPLETAKIAVFVFEDDSPLNGEVDTGGGIDVLAPNEPGLGGFNLVLLDQAGMMGDSSGQITYDMFGMPVSNSLAGTIDPATGLDACPISHKNDGLVGVISTCPKYESDGKTLSPLAGHAIIANMYPGLYEVMGSPGADRIARGEEWLQTNTLDGTKAIEAFIKAGEPAYFQEFGPGGYHVAMGFANPKIINDRKNAICATAGNCSGNFYGMVTNTRMSRTPDQRVYSSGSYDAYAFAQCYVSLGAPDSDDFAFTKCNPDGTFAFTGIPLGNLRVTVFDQWNDLLVDGLSTPIKAVATGPGSSAATPLEVPVTQWRTNLYGRVFLDQNGDGVSQESEPGLPLVPYNIRYRDGSYNGFNNTDMAGYVGFNEVFPSLNWLVVDTDSARYKLSGVHVVYDTGGPVDGTTGGGSSTIANHLANTIESPTAHLPADLRVPGARYCADADCTGTGSFDPSSGNAGSSGRVDPPWATTQGWQGLLGQNSFIEFAMKPFAPGENGGIKGHVIYTTTRPFDDPALLLQLSWEPGVANVKVNLYKEDTGPDGTKTLKLVDTTMTTSWDDFAQGFRSDGKPNMNCPGQETSSPFYFTMLGGTQALNPATPLPYEGRYKCYDGWSMLNQVQPAPYNGMYKFPSVTARDPVTGKPTATNCTGCVANTAAPATDFDYNAPMLPAGKYVVEVIVPDGYELVKEEDKNILLGDAFIAPVTQQFAGLGNIFIMPDQAAMNAYYNAGNPIQSTTNNGAVPRREGDTGSVEVFWPCAGAMRIVPDYISLFPAAGQAAPFAGASRPLCDRKEVTLNDEMSVLAKFYIFNSTHIASAFAGTITNDFASEFDPFSPQFGEKFAVPNVPVALRDFSGKEISRVYADQWGYFNGMTFSSYTVNPPSPSGYVPQMMIACMNDPGPIADPANPGQMITDPMYNPAYSNFCYEWSFMPGQTSYLDTPVIPTMASAAAYNLPDCEYMDTTPAIKSVLGQASNGGAGPWVSAPGQSITISALGDRQVLNHAYSGPMATTAPFNQKFVTRHYGFGSTSGTAALVGSDGVSHPLTGVSWSDLSITGMVPDIPASASTCPIQQRAAPATTRCAQLVITAANGRQSIDTVTVTIGGKAPAYVTAQSPSISTFGHIQPNPLQTAIDNAAPGDLIIVGPGTYKENLLMWKPVRLQGVGAESVTINADAHPAGKMDAWRRQLNCLFGLSLNGQPITSSNAYDPTGTGYSCPDAMRQHVDRIDFEAILGWDVLGNGNLAQMLQEPTLMGAYEGAGVTVLGKGVWMPAGTSVADQFGAATAGGFPANYRYLNANADCRAPNSSTPFWREYSSTNFLCNPSRIDGVSIINSSQGGGAVFAHAWNHNLEVSNLRVHGNHGTLTGGITIGTGEFPDPFIVLSPNDPNFDGIPFDYPGNTPIGTQLGYGFNRNVHVHHNAVTANASIGDALYSGTPSAAGGVTFSPGADGYMFNNNWVCGNLSTGDSGGVAHSGFSNDGTMAHNWILFNQTQSPTIPTNGGGIGVMGASPDRIIRSGPNAGLECGALQDLDCAPGLPEGTGRNLLIDANLIIGNSAESGTGGGLRLQMVNGQEVIAFPDRPNRVTSGPQAQRSPGWNDVTVSNNIIANNVAGWDGGGVSMQDAFKVKFINNTVINNDTTASAGVLFNTLGAPLASVPPPGCFPNSDPTQPQDPSCLNNPVKTSTNQAAGFVTMQNTPNMTAALPASVVCPSGYGYSTLANGECRQVSLPQLGNNVLWHNRAFHVEVGALGTGQQAQQAVVTLVPALNQALTGACATQGTDVGAPGSGGPVNYWDIGVRGDTGPTGGNQLGTGGTDIRLAPSYSILSSGGYTGNNNLGDDPLVVSQYCNGARIPPENCTGVAAIDQPRCKGYNAPAGHSEFTGLPVVFALNQLTVAATVDEGNNWINLGYGPLALANAAIAPGTGVAQAPLGNYSITTGSPAINTAGSIGAPNHDFFGTARPQGSGIDIGAVELGQAVVVFSVQSPVLTIVQAPAN